MLPWLLRRLLSRAIIVFLAATATFALVSLTPGDITQHLDSRRITPEARERWRHDFGLDRPVPLRYLHWLGAVVRGNLGYSWLYHRNVSTVLATTLPRTLLLTGLGLLLEVLGGMTVALVQIRRPHGFVDRLASTVTLTAYALPSFWTGLLLIYLFAYRFPLFPPSHMLSPAGELATGWQRLGDLLPHLVLPAATIGAAGVGAIARYLRGSLLDERLEHYVLAARARGCSMSRAMWVHALPNALLPLVTVVGMSLPFLVSGSLVVEVVFAWPGMGRAMYEAALARDVPLLMGGTLVAATAVVAGNLAADVLYAVVDPRVRT
jgi:peptide/nickel transport system permease protein